MVDAILDEGWPSDEQVSYSNLPRDKAGEVDLNGPLRVRGDNWGFTDLYWKNGAVFLCASRSDFLGVLVENWSQVDPEAVKALLEKPR